MPASALPAPLAQWPDDDGGTNAQYVRQMRGYLREGLALVRTRIDRPAAGSEVHPYWVRRVHACRIAQYRVVLAGRQAVVEPGPGGTGVVSAVDGKPGIRRNALTVSLERRA